MINVICKNEPHSQNLSLLMHHIIINKACCKSSYYMCTLGFKKRSCYARGSPLPSVPSHPDDPCAVNHTKIHRLQSAQVLTTGHVQKPVQERHAHTHTHTSKSSKRKRGQLRLGTLLECSETTDSICNMSKLSLVLYWWLRTLCDMVTCFGPEQCVQVL